MMPKPIAVAQAQAIREKLQAALDSIPDRSVGVSSNKQANLRPKLEEILKDMDDATA
jgi:hypothetical protein